MVVLVLLVVVVVVHECVHVFLLEYVSHFFQFVACGLRVVCEKTTCDDGFPRLSFPFKGLHLSPGFKEYGRLLPILLEMQRETPEQCCVRQFLAES